MDVILVGCCFYFPKLSCDLMLGDGKASEIIVGFILTRRSSANNSVHVCCDDDDDGGRPSPMANTEMEIELWSFGYWKTILSYSPSLLQL